ncbi:MAG: hypothetical protein QF819_11000 [Gemmatimonadota bacterium]|jgi:hypothetical protein|nr:hypothetical protein [Gemmatimonadota bacterium]MDP6803677.1 hypothetical protein [Gemmatimonadota bacterium]MDP7032787.1 hypothetical protein [Gemmatimonadota bacterium]
MRLRAFWIATFAAGVLALSGCATRTVYVRTAPPAARKEVRPASPGATHVWKAGHWTWKRGRYKWVPGHWEKSRRGAHWTPGHWKKTPRGWVWRPGHWK